MKLSEMKKRIQMLKNLKSEIERRSDTADNPNPEYIRYLDNVITSQPGGSRGYYKRERDKLQLRNKALRNILTNYPEVTRKDYEMIEYLKKLPDEKFEKFLKFLKPGDEIPEEYAERMGMIPMDSPSRRRILGRDSGGFDPNLTDAQLATAFAIMKKSRYGKYDPDYGRALLRKKKKSTKIRSKRKPVKRCKCK